MHRHIGRAELIDRLLPELRATDPDGSEVLAAFSRVVLRRVDDKYLYRHRLTTLGAQLRESFAWVRDHAGRDDVTVRVFEPTQDDGGYELEGLVLETLMPDQPFIVDTLKLWAEQAGVRVLNSLHVVVPTTIDDSGQLVAVDTRRSDARHVSYTRWYIDFPPSGTEDELLRDAKARLELSRAMVRGFYRIVRSVKDIANEFEYLATLDPHHNADCLEVRDYLQWLAADHFVFMGVSFFERTPDGGVKRVPDRGLGAMSPEHAPAMDGLDLDGRFFRTATRLGWPMLRVQKSSQESLVHRPGKVDEILLRLYDDRGQPCGGVAIHGLFTFKGLSEAGSRIPILRRKLDRLLAEDGGVVPGGYEYKGLVNAFNTLPVEYLFEADLGAIRHLLRMIVTADATHEIHSQVVINDDARSAYAFVVIPKEHYHDELRQEMQRALRSSLKASYVDHRVYLGKFGSVAVHFYLTGGADFGTATLEEVECQLVEIGTPWSYRLRQRLELDYGETRCAELDARYGDAFPEAYTSITPATVAVVDVHHLEALGAGEDMRFHVFAHPSHADQALLRIYAREPMQLTAILPVVDNFGVVVAEQFAFEVFPADAKTPLAVNTLRVLRGDHDVVAQGPALIDGLRAVFRRRMPSDRLNRLLLGAQLTWAEVDLIRAYQHYSRQLGHAHDPELQQKVLMANTAFVAGLVRVFRLRFDPDLEVDDARRASNLDRALAEARRLLDTVKTFEEDRILRTYLDLIEATVRTNFYRSREDGEHFISVKLDCARVREMPEPRPLFEIYVHHARVEGVHLRGGRVARGGIRWSDRLDDYRSEILGLMATQMLKNTLIVPVGAKGGFILKDPVEDYGEARQRADRLYRIFIRGLLEVTDNLVDGEIVPPPRVRRYDPDDPYLVVAADKGTAHLSDTANEVARSFRFWLDDAFASGGSVGYDHKIKGITARGAWVCVRRHFQELGVDPELDEISAVGIGDMSGDVFGNGLLCSRTIKLRAAFNHRHILIDPDPEPETSFVERKRLFDTPGTHWTDYDAAVISAGGGVFERGAKEIALSPEAQAMLVTEAEAVSGEELIRLVLCAPVDLLWNGGIGTYVKASFETHSDVEDKANDRVRVSAADLRCRVIGEGGNLGVTMKGRVEYAARGGRINLDAVDNSGGVDLSDHEVNLKILMQPAVSAGDLGGAARNELLVEVGDLVCEQVLANSASQSLAISVDEHRSQANIWPFVRALDVLRKRIGFSRRMQHLPRSMRLLEDRSTTHKGLLRPELAKLLSYSKMLAYAALVEHPVGTREELLPWLEAYFPARVVEVLGEHVSTHMLFAEIAATVQVNHITEIAGASFFPNTTTGSERPIRDIAAAWLLAEDLIDARELRARVLAMGEDAGGVAALSTGDVYDALVELTTSLAEATRCALAFNPGPLTLGSRRELDGVAEVASLILRSPLDVLPESAHAAHQQRLVRWSTAGVPADLAQQLAAAPQLAHAFGIADLARRTNLPSEVLASLYFAVGHGSRVFPLLQSIGRQSYKEAWDQIALYSVERTLLDGIQRLTEQIVATGKALPTAPQLESALWAMPEMSAMRDDFEAVLRKPIPVAALFVLGERLRRRIDALERASRDRTGLRAPIADAASHGPEPAGPSPDSAWDTAPEGAAPEDDAPRATSAPA